MDFQLVSHGPLRPIHYLGSKLRLASVIVEAIHDAQHRPGAVLDIFAGSGTVSGALAPHGPVVSNDIQEYSRVLCSALLTPRSIPLSAVAIVEQVNRSSFRQELLETYEPLLSYERYALAELRRGNASPIATLQAAVPIDLVSSLDDPKAEKALREVKKRLGARELSKLAATVSVRHFGGTYFSIQQALDICALSNHAFSHATGREDLLAPVLSTASDVVNSVGKQFAQPVKVLQRNGVAKKHLIPKLIADKSLDVMGTYAKWLDRYQERAATLAYQHAVLRGDFIDALSKPELDVSIVYADPPYGREHYSRYYHVLETICLRDNPIVSFDTSSPTARWSTGAYRVGRHQSPFCIKSQAPAAFESLVAMTREKDASLVISYSPTAEGRKPRYRVVELDFILSLAKRYYRDVKIEPVTNVRHNKMNRVGLNSEQPQMSEVVVTCIC